MGKLVDMEIAHVKLIPYLETEEHRVHFIQGGISKVDFE